MSRFIDNVDKTVTDSQTGLTWTKETIAKDVNHEAAQKAVDEMGEGWRLPTIQELFTLADHSRIRPAIDTDAFPDTENDWYWSSTLYADNPSAAWFVGFYDGGVYGYHRDNDACVRAVRSSQ